MNPTELRETASAFQKSRIVLTAFELDIFTHIGEKRYDSGSVSKALNLNQNATERLLNALVALGLMEKHEGKYNNTKTSLAFLSKDSPEYMAGLMHSNHLWDTWSHLTDAVRTGNAAQTAEINERGEEWLEAFIEAMHHRGKKQAPAQTANIELHSVASVLDVGGGSGCYCMALMNRKPGLKAVVFDLPNVLPISQKIIDREGFGGRIELHSGDYTTDALPTGYDLVFLSAIIHGNSYEANMDLLKKCYQSLNPNGKIVIQDWIMSSDRTAPAQGAIFSINMLVGVEGGDCYTEDEVRTWMRSVGFSGISKVPLDGGLAQMTGIVQDE